MGKIKNTAKMTIKGFLKITEYDEDSKNPKILLKKENAIHAEHASLLIARGIGGKEQGGKITEMAFGDGGATVDADDNINLNSTNVTAGNADLHMQNHSESLLNDNDIAVTHVGAENYSDVIFRVTVDRNTSIELVDGRMTDDFTFSEIGLKDDTGQLITHITFAPIDKNSNRAIEIEYTLRIVVG